MYEFFDNLSIVCFIFVIVGLVMGIPVFLMEKAQERWGILNWWLRALYGKNWNDDSDFEEED